MKYLVKQELNYADEFDIHGMRIFDSISEITEMYAAAYKLGTIQYYFGTNQCLEVEAVDYIDACVCITISDKEAAFLNSLFGNEWGKFLDARKYLD